MLIFFLQEEREFYSKILTKTQQDNINEITKPKHSNDDIDGWEEILNLSRNITVQLNDFPKDILHPTLVKNILEQTNKPNNLDRRSINLDNKYSYCHKYLARCFIILFCVKFILYSSFFYQ